MRSATRACDHERAGYLLVFEVLGALPPEAWDLSHWARDRIERVRRRGIETTPPLPLDRDGARVASRQRPIVGHDVSSVSAPGRRRQGLSRRSGMEDFEGALEAQALAGPVVQRADMGV